MSLPFLLEIGTEEIPDWMIPDALENLRLLFEKLAIPHDSVTMDATPRRLVLRADGLPARQADSEERVLGPPKSAPAQAVAGFARKQGVAPADLAVETTPKGEYYTFTRKVAGRPIKDILADALPGIVLGIYFPKTMYWTVKGGPRFIRPIRWIVALLGEEIVPFELAGVHSGALTSGHRRLGAREIAVTTADYVERLRDHYVILSAEERREKIRRELAGIRVKADPALLETLVYITEYPTAISRRLRPAIPGAAGRGAGHRDAPPPEIFFGGRRPGPARAAFRRGDEYRFRPRRLRPPRQRARAARALQRRPLLLGDRSEKDAGRPHPRPGPRHLPGQAGHLPRKDRAHEGPGEGTGRRRPRQRARPSFPSATSPPSW